MPPLTIKEFIYDLHSEIDAHATDLYQKYLFVNAGGSTTFGEPGSPTAPLKTPNAVFTPPVHSDAEVKAAVDAMAKANSMEQLTLRVGKIGLTILIAAAKAGI